MLGTSVKRLSTGRYCIRRSFSTALWLRVAHTLSRNRSVSSLNRKPFIPATFRYYSSKNSKIEWTPSSLPNPMQNPTLGGRDGVKTSCICDPDNILSNNTKDVIEGYINSSKIQIAVVVISKISNSFVNAFENKEHAAKDFAIELHDKWGVGSADHHDGVLVFLSVRDRVVFFSTGSGVSDRLNEKAIQGIVTGMKEYLLAENYELAVEYAVLQVSLIVDENEKYQRSQNDENSKKWWRNGSIAVICMLVFGKVAWDSHQRSLVREAEYSAWLERHRFRMQSENALDRICESDDISCPHCLRLYNEISKHSSDMEDSDSVHKVTLKCGHKFCSDCYQSLVDTSSETGDVGTCSICASPLAIHQSSGDGWFRRDKTADMYSSVPHRLQRYFVYFRDVVDKDIANELHDSFGKSVEDGRSYVTKLRQEISQRREEEVKQAMEDEKAREKAAKSGSEGSRDSSFGGGSSSGGGGGSW